MELIDFKFLCGHKAFVLKKLKIHHLLLAPSRFLRNQEKLQIFERVAKSVTMSFGWIGLKDKEAYLLALGAPETTVL